AKNSTRATPDPFGARPLHRLSAVTLPRFAGEDSAGAVETNTWLFMFMARNRHVVQSLLSQAWPAVKDFRRVSVSRETSLLPNTEIPKHRLEHILNVYPSPQPA